MLDLTSYLNAFPLPCKRQPMRTLRQSAGPPTGVHAQLQGMLLEIGNLRGFGTFCPDRKALFNGRRLGEIASLKNAPVIPGIASDAACRVDVLWFDGDVPVDAFEMELSTGIWSGLVRLGEFVRLSTRLHIVTAGDARDFERKISAYVFKSLSNRCSHCSVNMIRELYNAERQVAALRQRARLDDQSSQPKHFHLHHG